MAQEAQAKPAARTPRRTLLSLPAGERIVIDMRPHPLFIILRSLGVLGVLAVLTGAGAWAAGALELPVLARRAMALGIALAGLRLAWDALEWLMRGYVLTERRVLRGAGVLRRYIADIPLARIQHVTLTKTLRERLFGLGTIGFHTAGTAWTEVLWIMVDRPEARLATVRGALAGGARAGPEGERAREEAPAESRGAASAGGRRPAVVIGLAGGIGAGKSEVARMMGELGCEVIDSDAQAKAALEMPRVRATLAEWWGAGVLGEDGTVDRQRIAEIVFADEGERRRLEGLIHPLVRAERGELKRRAEEAGARAIVIDAPLLFEAGVDAECDVVVFVDCPEDVRLERLARTRGWGPAEVRRREKAQLPLEEKARRADYRIVNDGDTEALRRGVRALLEEILRRPTAPTTGGATSRLGRDGGPGAA